MTSKKLTPKQFELFTHTQSMVVDPLVTDLVERCKDTLDNQHRLRWLMITHPSKVYEVLSDRVSTSAIATISGFNVDISKIHHRFSTFCTSAKCVVCGLEGNAVLLELPSAENSAPSLKLYHVSEKELVMMTVDHVLPDSYGGKYHKSNFQTMCNECNRKKQNLMSLEDIICVRAAPTQYAKPWVHPALLTLVLDVHQSIHDHPELGRVLRPLASKMTAYINHGDTVAQAHSNAVKLRREFNEILKKHKQKPSSPIRTYVKKWIKFWSRVANIVKKAGRDVASAYDKTVAR